MRTSLALSCLFLLLAGFTPSAHAQTRYEMKRDNSLVRTGCLEPSPCDCATQFVGRVEGDFQLEIIPPPLGPIFEFTVEDVDWTLHQNIGPDLLITGNGTYVVDLVAGTHQMTLDLVVDGTPQQFMSSGDFGPDATNYPQLLEIDLYSALDTCEFDGIQVRAVLMRDFRRGDCNDDGTVDIGDPVATLPLLFSQPAPPPCVDACDANGDGNFNLGDTVYLLNHLFVNGPAPTDPFPTCGLDPTAEQLFCLSFESCP